MKKILLALAIGSISLLTLNSCTKEYITNNFLPGITYTHTIQPGDWVEDGVGSGVYAVDIPFPELDAQYYNFGTTQVALEFANSSTAFDAIPATIRETHYSFSYQVGLVTIFAETRSPEADDIDRPIVVKITLTDADNGGN
ncbi:hypothetical protein FAZ19_05570 [Sphingobacterium alkalisoli]|uniref:Uncharacterized protein n=1 Tax=Sphingobacterium alkalisoli TaxID=1874115 RepID=A0A4U0HDI9_9SPHI|nr:hypothetical protein [Sphingobacterium alkalisoli]TJY68722.1 hypothetical protein FAZ19_05570 [Sphingobacterium alkalisoli]GGH04530.1 hypothetical protein GCM10011418_00250 [Sphingobacterium alkalisoli]